MRPFEKPARAMLPNRRPFFNGALCFPESLPALRPGEMDEEKTFRSVAVALGHHAAAKISRQKQLIYKIQNLKNDHGENGCARNRYEPGTYNISDHSKV